MELTTSQRKAVEHAGKNLQLIACAGSGKTEVVARRVVHLLTSGKPYPLTPANIIAFTFTEKAAAELKERIVSRTRDELGNLPGMAEMFVGTIHAFCLDLLQTESPEHRKYEVLNEVQQMLFIDRHSKQSGLTTSTDLQGKPLRRYRHTELYLAALSILREAELDEEKLSGCSLLDGLEAYRELLDAQGYFDYSAILEKALDLLVNDEGVRSRLSKRIKYVIVDEYQDVNPIQEAIIRSLHDLGARLCVVGDDDQTIYQWRGSDVSNILTFAERYPDVDQVALEENFRSSQGIVETARHFIEQNASRLPKRMRAAGTQSYEKGDIVALSFTSSEDEAQYIASVAQELRGIAFEENGEERGLSWSDMAILLRSVKANAGPIMDALRDANIPFVVTGMANLFAAPEAEAARQLFYFMADMGPNEAALERAWISANLDLDPEKLRTAILYAAEAKAALTDPDQKRWGQYSIQRVFLNFLEKAGVQEQDVPGERGEVVFYNLGKFSQLISDFEAIHFRTKPLEKYKLFGGFLRQRAENAYPEGWLENRFASPDAIHIMTIHQAKGMQWPVVFVPALLKNRFPGKKPGGKNVWHLLPSEAVKGQKRFEGTIEDERRLFYVAMTRSQKFLHLTWAPIANNRLFQKPSPFWNEVLVSKFVKRTRPDYSKRRRLPPQPRTGVSSVVFSFSDLKYFFECPYQFKLRILYGFNAPIHEALGYGKSLHDALSEIHARAIRGEIVDPKEVPQLVETHLHTPYAYPELRKQLKTAAERVICDYLTDNAASFDKIEFCEKQIEINLGDGITVNGRIDLVRRLDTGETTIVDLKSSERAQAENVTEAQLHTYALGYQELTGKKPDYVEIYELDERQRKPRAVDEDLIVDVTARTRKAAEALRSGVLTADPEPVKCGGCDYRGMCIYGQNVTR